MPATPCQLSPIIAGLLSLAIPACAEPDAGPVDACAGVTDTGEAAGASSAATGTLDGERFVSFADGDRLLIIDGLQGGTWVMPAARFAGVSREGELGASIELETGAPVSAIDGVPVRLDEAGAGLQLDFVPIPVGDAADLSGRPAVLRVELVDACGRVAEGAIGIVLQYEGTSS